MTVVIGPVLKRADGYEFDTWTAGKEVARGYPYRRIEDAYYARNTDIKASAQGRAPAAIVCQTLDEFIVKLTEDGYPEPYRVSRRQVCLSPTRPLGRAQAGHSRRLPPRRAGCFRSARAGACS
jgi:hypothetical protein